jgi:hypothetical protein
MFEIDLKALFWSIASFIIAFLFFTFMYDDSYDGLANNLSVGQFTPFSLMDWHYLGILWVKEIFMILQDTFPKINVFFSICIALNFISIYYLFVTLNKTQESNRNNLVWIIQVAFLLMAVDALIFITHTRFATLFTGLALFNLSFFRLNSKIQIGVHIVAFLFGFLVRPESGIGAMIFVIPGLFLYGQPILRLLKVSILPISCAILFFATLETHKLFTDRLEILIEPDIEYAMSTDKFKPKTARNELDSVRYDFARNAFFIDTSFVDDKYLKSIISNRTSFDIIAFFKSIRHVSQFYISYSIVTFALVFLFISLLFTQQFKALLKVLIYNLVMFFILTILDYQINIADRHFSALIILMLIVSVVFYDSSKINHQLRYLNLVFLVLLFFPIQSTWSYIQQNNRNVIERVKTNLEILNKFENRIQGRNVIVTISSFKLFDKPYSFFTSNRTKNNYFVYDLSTYSIVPRHINYLSSKCNCKASVPLYFFLWLEKTNAILIIDESRVLILKKYFKNRFNKNIQFLNEKGLNNILDTQLWPELKFKTVHFLNDEK